MNVSTTRTKTAPRSQNGLRWLYLPRRSKQTIRQCYTAVQARAQCEPARSLFGQTNAKTRTQKPSRRANAPKPAKGQRTGSGEGRAPCPAAAAPETECKSTRTTHHPDKPKRKTAEANGGGMEHNSQVKNVDIVSSSSQHQREVQSQQAACIIISSVQN